MTPLFRPDPITRPSGDRTPLSGTADSIWMITITDLILLLFAFFVLLFAMMTPEAPLTPSAPHTTDLLPTRADAPLGIETTAARQERNIEAVLPPEAFETAYFGALLEDVLKDSPHLKGTETRIYPDVITLRLPAAVRDAHPATPGDPEPLSPLARFLERLGRKVVISGCRAPAAGESADAWSRGLEDAAKMANNLKKAGFFAPVDIQSQLAASPSGEGVYLYILAEGEEP